MIASLVGVFIDYAVDTQVDYWLHDPAVVYQQRQTWKHTGIVVLDDGVPARVTRLQALPLFAKAVEHLVAQGAKGVFLDSRVSKELEGLMPYAVCVERDGQARWSQPKCGISPLDQQCRISNSEAGTAPLKMSSTAIKRFRIAPYMDIGAQLPDFLLYDWDAAEAIPPGGLSAKDRLVTKNTPIARWVDMNNDHAIFKLVSLLDPKLAVTLFEKNRLDELCDDKRCRRIRLTEPYYKISTNPNQLILPLSQLAACDDAVADKAAALLKNKLVILQATAPNESTDILVTPMTTALFGPQLMTPGAQYLVDELETVLNQDFPQTPPQTVRILLFVCAALSSVLLGAYFSHALLWLGGIVIFLAMAGLCFLNPVMQLWPMTAVMAAYCTGAIQIVSLLLISGFRQGNLLSQYLPKQVIDALMPLKNAAVFQHRQCRVVVLISDLAGYTTVTELLKEPENVMNLMNDYLGATSIVLQDKYHGILEAYVGDMFCYYWEYENDAEEQQVYKQVLSAAIELAILQKHFFSSVADRYKEILTPEVIEKISTIINAGIGITTGSVVKGNLGPKDGVKKFAILGDPLNLASRLESLTRLFNSEIIIAGDFAKTASSGNLVVRRLGTINVKGREKPETLYALGAAADPRFSAENINAWELWISKIEAGLPPDTACPDIYSKDKKTILNWQSSGRLADNGSWQLHEK